MSKLLRSVVVVAATIALSGCYASDRSIIAPPDRVQPLKEGHYCEYDYDMATGKPGGKCVPAKLARARDGSYLLMHDGEDSAYTVSISSRTVTAGSFKGYAVTEACYSDKNGSGCFVGLMRMVDGGTAEWVLPKCTAPQSGPDPCKMMSQDQALAAFAAAGPDLDDTRRLVWTAG